MAPSGRMRMTRTQRLQLCQYKREVPSATRADLCAWAVSEFQLLKRPSESCVTAILQREPELRRQVGEEMASKRRRRATRSDVGQLTVPTTSSSLSSSSSSSSSSSISSSTQPTRTVATMTRAQELQLYHFNRQFPDKTGAELATWAARAFALEHEPTEAAIAVMLERLHADRRQNEGLNRSHRLEDVLDHPDDGTSSVTTPSHHHAPKRAGTTMRRGSNLTMAKEQQLQLYQHKKQFPGMTRVELGAWAAHTFDLAHQPSEAAIAVILEREEGRELVVEYRRKKALASSTMLAGAQDVNSATTPSIPPGTQGARATNSQVSRLRMTKAQQLQLCNYKRDFPSTTREQLSEWAMNAFALPKRPSRTAIANILGREEELHSLAEDELKRKKKGDPERRKLVQPVLEEMLAREQDGFLSYRLIREIAKKQMTRLQIPEAKRPLLSKGWLHHLQLGIRSSKVRNDNNKEADYVDIAGFTRELAELQALASSYDPENVYNLNKTAFNYHMSPNRSICRGRAASWKADSSRITAVFCSNTRGSDVRPPWFISPASRPRRANRDTTQPDNSWRLTATDPMGFSDWVHTSGAKYKNVATGWMNTTLFEQYVMEFNAVMKDQDRHVLLLVDHTVIHNWDPTRLTNVVIKALPANTTSICQPLDETVMTTWKSHVLQRKTELYARCRRARKSIPVNVFTAINWGIEAWHDITPLNIQSGWNTLVPVTP